MVSLTTVYILSVILASVAGMGSAFAGDKMIGGTIVSKEPPKEEQPVPEATSQPSLSEAIQTGFGMNSDFANNVMMFIKTPVTEWKQIAGNPSELRRKFMQTLTHENLNKCPQNLKDVCKLVSIKYSNMKDFIEGNPYQNYGDQTQEATALLSSTG